MSFAVTGDEALAGKGAWTPDGTALAIVQRQGDAAGARSGRRPGPARGGDPARVRTRLRRLARIQLVGDHELQCLGGGRFWKDPAVAADADLVRSWWLGERVRLAAALRTADGDDLLVTHAGLAFGAWRALGEPVAAATAAELLNTRPEELVWARDGPLWARTRRVYESWLAAPVAPPFGQVHGQSSIVDFAAGRGCAAPGSGSGPRWTGTPGTRSSGSVVAGSSAWPGGRRWR